MSIPDIVAVSNWHICQLPEINIANTLTIWQIYWCGITIVQ